MLFPNNHFHMWLLRLSFARAVKQPKPKNEGAPKKRAKKEVEESAAPDDAESVAPKQKKRKSKKAKN